MNRAILLITVIVITTFSCQQSDTTSGKSVCETYDQTDKVMLDLIDQIEQKYVDDRRFLNRLSDAQVYWVQYRDRHIRALFPRDIKDYKKEHKDRYFDCKCEELTKLTKQRISELSRWMGAATDCPNSIR